MMKAGNRVEQFIADTLSVDEAKGNTLISIRKLILSIYPEAQEEIKYGGLVFNVDAKLIGGIFTRQKHISLEFSFGYQFSDPEKRLEGNGKYRRHLKIMHDDDIKNKDVSFFVSQAFNI
ncbi:MAG: DUF1801 domain-containing protein [Gammaproteobacteria bacterium]|nr:DUF1801 domain-containing protein [Gammaproteobacteria bacterium]